MRKKFNVLFNDLLKTQLILKGVIVEQDWEELKEKIQYRYAQDQYFEEMKSAENIRNRLDLLNQVQPFVGYYFSKEYVEKNILRMTDNDIKQMEAQIQDEPSPPQMGMDQNINNNAQ